MTPSNPVPWLALAPGRRWHRYGAGFPVPQLGRVTVGIRRPERRMERVQLAAGTPTRPQDRLLTAE